MTSDGTAGSESAGTVSLRFESMRELIAGLAPWLGPEGVFVASDAPLPEGSQVELELKVRDQLKLLHGTAQVAWVRRAPGGGGQPAGMALRFLEIDRAGRRFVERLVENHRQGGGSSFDLAASRPPESRLAELTEGVSPRSPAAPEPRLEAPGPEEPATTPEVPFPSGPPTLQEAFPPSFLDEVEAEIRSAPVSPPHATPLDEAAQAELEPDAPLELEDLTVEDAGLDTEDLDAESLESADLDAEELTLEVELPDAVEEDEEWPEPIAPAVAPGAPEYPAPGVEEPAEAVSAEPEPELEAGEVEAEEILEPEEPRREVEDLAEEAPPAEPAPAAPARRDLLSLPDLPPIEPLIDRAPPAAKPLSPPPTEIFEPPDDLPHVESPEIAPGAQFAEPRGARRTWAVLLFSLLTVGVLAALFLLGDRLLGIWRQGSVETVAVPSVDPSPPPERRPPVTPPSAGAPADEAAAPAPAEPPAELPARQAKPATPPAAGAPATGVESEAPQPEPAPAAPRGSPDRGPVAAAQIESVEWEQSGAATVVTVTADGPIRPADVGSFRLDGASPRHVIKIAGIRQPLARPVRTVGTAQIARIRSGLHELPGGTELHLVFDLAGPEVVLEGQAPSPSGVRLTFRSGAGG